MVNVQLDVEPISESDGALAVVTQGKALLTRVVVQLGSML
jgi:hypothetical protein